VEQAAVVAQKLKKSRVHTRIGEPRILLTRKTKNLVQKLVQEQDRALEVVRQELELDRVLTMEPDLDLIQVMVLVQEQDREHLPDLVTEQVQAHLQDQEHPRDLAMELVQEHLQGLEQQVLVVEHQAVEQELPAVVQLTMEQVLAQDRVAQVQVVDRALVQVLVAVVVPAAVVECNIPSFTQKPKLKNEKPGSHRARLFCF
jgi:urocanate hydratase